MPLVLLGFLLSILAPFVTEWLRDLWERFSREAEVLAPTHLQVKAGSPSEQYTRYAEFITEVGRRGRVRDRLFAAYLRARLRREDVAACWAAMK